VRHCSWRGQYIEPMLASMRLPTPCAVCRLWASTRVCAPCVQRYAPAADRCLQCAAKVPAGVARCGGCITDPPPFARSVAAVDYAFPWSGLIAAFKFHQSLDLTPVLATLMTDALRTAYAGQRWPEVVLPVPLSEQRLRERGMNQAWELARRAAQALKLSARHGVLQRAIDTPHLANLPRQDRAQRIRGAFLVPDTAAVRGHAVALVDDVLTTGATAGEATRTLLAAGAREVHVWMLARTLAPD
jgi:ComF family protein